MACVVMSLCEGLVTLMPNCYLETILCDVLRKLSVGLYGIMNTVTFLVGELMVGQLEVQITLSQVADFTPTHRLLH